jgi:hypothetical protein
MKSRSASTRLPRSPDDVISLARHGKIKPAEAEAEAKARGWTSFEQRPADSEYDPMQEARWSMPMALAWIAWRDLHSVREQHAQFRSMCTHWIFREWSAPAKSGVAFEKHNGWFLESWSRATGIRLRLLERILESRGEIPPTRQMSIADSERTLWEALYQGHLTGLGSNDNGPPLAITQREWSALKLFEERDFDVLKYDALDAAPAFTNVTFERVELLASWPPVSARPVEKGVRYPITANMIGPISRIGDAGYVPMCVALHWIMTKGGLRDVFIDNEELWHAACRDMLALIHENEVELVGISRVGQLSESIPGQLLAAIKILRPLDAKLNDILLGAPSHIACCAFENEKDWFEGLNDRLYVAGKPGPVWSHLAIRKSQILQHWPRPPSQAKPEHACRQWLTALMRLTPTRRPKTKGEFWIEAQTKFHGLKDRQFKRCWSEALAESQATGWSRPGPATQGSDQGGE